MATKKNSDQRTWDYLNKLSKAQIISFLKENYFISAPDKRQVDRYYWHITTEELLCKSSANIAKSKEMSDEINRLSKQLQECSDVKKSNEIHCKLLQLRIDYSNNNSQYWQIHDKIEKLSKMFMQE